MTQMSLFNFDLNKDHAWSFNDFHWVIWIYAEVWNEKKLSA